MIKKILVGLMLTGPVLAQPGVLIDVRPLGSMDVPGGTYVTPAPGQKVASQQPQWQQFLCIYRAEDGTTQAVQKVIRCPARIELKD